jgi:4-aminobutyrate aminotransferase-like enzyme
LGKVLFAPGGTLAIGMALKLARLATGRHKTLSLWDSFHGASLDAISIGGEAVFRKNMGPLLPGTGALRHRAIRQACRFGCGGVCKRQVRGVHRLRARQGGRRRRGDHRDRPLHRRPDSRRWITTGSSAMPATVTERS